MMYWECNTQIFFYPSEATLFWIRSNIVLGFSLVPMSGLSTWMPFVWKLLHLNNFCQTFKFFSIKGNSTEAQRYHCKYNFATASFILLPWVLFYCREFYFTAASFVLLPRDLFYCREFYFSTASFILLPRVLLYHREFYFAAASFIFTTASFNLLQVVKIKLAVVKIKLVVLK